MDTIPQDDTPRKRCTGECNRLLPATPEYFALEKYGQKECLRHECKECRRKKARDRYYQPGIHEQKLAQAKAYREIPEVKEYRQSFDKEWRQRPDVQEHLRNYMQVYRVDYYAQPENRERRSAVDKVYARRPDVREHRRPKDRVYSHNRRARLKGIPGTHTPEQIREQYDRQRGKCYYCRVKVDWGKHHIDHVVPITRGGSNDISNLVIACPSCNARKNDRLPHEWPEGGRLL